MIDICARWYLKTFTSQNKPGFGGSLPKHQGLEKSWDSAWFVMTPTLGSASSQTILIMLLIKMKKKKGCASWAKDEDWSNFQSKSRGEEPKQAFVVFL